MLSKSTLDLEPDFKITANQYKEVILQALNEDLLPDGDVTSAGLIVKTQNSEFNLVLNESAILAGVNIFKDVLSVLDKNISFEGKFKDGDKVDKKNIIANISGNTRSVLKGERTALNFLCHLSGIATVTKRMVDLIKDTGVVLLDTRKTTPLLRAFEKYALRMGGAKNHRYNLSEMILIKDNHIANIGSVEKAILKAREYYGDKYKIEVEIENLEQLEVAIKMKPDIIMFDNWSVADLEQAVNLVPGDILTEASGQINPDNVLAYARTGVKYISTSYMVKNAKWIDYSLDAV